MNHSEKYETQKLNATMNIKPKLYRYVLGGQKSIFILHGYSGVHQVNQRGVH